MTSAADKASRVADIAAGLSGRDRRQLLAIAGPPGVGKSTIAGLAQEELHRRGIAAGVVAMDGFHYDNAILSQRHLLSHKGAPETFDIAGFHALLNRLLREDEVAVPEFDRALDAAIAARSVIARDQRIVLVEGNYLLLDEPGWSDLYPLWAARVFLQVDQKTLEHRLVQRWVQHGLSAQAAQDRALSNDIPNAQRVLENSRPDAVVL